VRAEGVITSNPFHVIFANPEDCGEIAVSGIDQDDKPVIGLFHASRHQVDRQVYIQSLGYLCESRGIEPEALSVKLSPSARAESYAFPDIAESQKVSPRWQGYVQQDDQGLWHVDFHNLMLDDLRSFGIKDEQMVVSSGDTAHPDSDYYSYSQYVKGQREDGGNSLLFALR
jgi:copper oxidase (laccase) domain-containing protein